MCADAAPFVSVIMPIRNEAGFIARSLGSVLAQTFPADRMEILIADGRSDDGTRERIRALCGDDPRVVIVDNPGRIVPTGFNAALRVARGDVVVRVDGHCEIEPDYVERCLDALASSGADNVGGLQRASDATGTFAAAVSIANSSRFGVGGARFHYATEPCWVDTVYLGAYRRDVFERIGGFDEDLVRNQDDEFNFRLTRAGGKIRLDPAIRSTYYARPTLRRVWRQYFEYGLYKVLVIRKHGRVPSWRHLVPATLVVALTASAVVSAVTARIWWFAALGGAYVAADLAASVARGVRNPRALPYLPVVFPAMHLSYGAGFLRGLWRWRGAQRARAGRGVEEIRSTMR